MPSVLEANINFATEKAAVEYLPGVARVRDLERAVEGASYGVAREERIEDVREREYVALCDSFVVAAVLTAFILIGSLLHMFGLEAPIPTRWPDFGLLLLATPVQF
jgi:Cu+-exporting ATPase